MLRIGSRDSALAKIQAIEVQQKLQTIGTNSEIIFSKSEGDINLVQPLYEFNISGVFTKTLDIALLNNKIDIAVHSYKDVPTKLAKGLCVGAVLARANPCDVLVRNPKNKNSTIVATSSLRRKFQFLNKYPNFTTEPIRGNINTRLTKLANSNWFGAIFAKAGLDRLSLQIKHTEILDWMIPAPAQGAICLVVRESDTTTLNYCKLINHINTEICTTIERNFLSALQLGCSAPVGALAELRNDTILFNACVHDIKGKQIALQKIVKYEPDINFGKIWGEQLLSNAQFSLHDKNS